MNRRSSSMRVLTRTILFMAFFSLGLLLPQESLSCSMYKITVDGHTMVGCNEDNWRSTPRIWFERAKNTKEWHAAFTGSRKVGAKRFTPQSGMNSAGLVFSRLASYHPMREEKGQERKPIGDEAKFLSRIVHECANIDEVKAFVEPYDFGRFIDDVFIYIDKSGRYLIVEPYTLIEGHDPSYVLANFCPSIAPVEVRRRQDRYRQGEDFLGLHHPEASLAYCTSLSDSMHVCRGKVGDGTLLTSIWDTHELTVTLYFYHDYDKPVNFNLTEEWGQVDRMLEVDKLFPPNSEFEALKKYITPFSHPPLRVALVLLGGLLCLLALFFFFQALRSSSSRWMDLSWVLGNTLLCIYFAILATEIGVYYFEAPYEHFQSSFISTCSYIPALMSIAMIPLFYQSYSFMRKRTSRGWVKPAIVLNALIYIAALVGFIYWGLIAV